MYKEMFNKYLIQMHRFKELDVWINSIKLVEDVYKATSGFPGSEQFGITNQIRRSAVSIPSNIAEGAGKNTNVDFCRFISIASGSCNELETQLLISYKLNYLSSPDYKKLEIKLLSIQNMLFGLQRSLHST